jgi:hypothetical protein
MHNQDPFAPQENLDPPHAEATVHPQSQGEPPTDEDLEELTSDLDSASTFDFNGQPFAAATGVEESAPPAAGNTSGMMDLNDLVPGHLLPQMEAQNSYPVDSIDAPQQVNEEYVSAVPADYSPDQPVAPEQPAGFSVPYSAHASTSVFQTPEAAAQAEARRKTEEFMRTFNAQRQVETTEDSQYAQPIPPAAPENLAAPSDGQSQEILKEIFSQQQILDEVHYTNPAQAIPQQPVTPEQSVDGLGADSVSIETPVTGFQNYQQPGEPPATQDDRDMLYVNETQQYSSPQPAEPPQPPPFPKVETSTGNAQRMDYNQLFEQLRNPTPEQ